MYLYDTSIIFVKWTYFEDFDFLRVFESSSAFFLKVSYSFSSEWSESINDEFIQLIESQFSVTQNSDEMIRGIEWKNKLMGAELKIKIKKPLK